MSGTPVRILLVRHGETVFNVEGRWQGQADSPLTERGQAQARELGRALADEPIVAVYSSDLGRAMSTAIEVAAQHELEVVGDRRLRELNTGDWTGKNRAQIAAEFPGLQEVWAATPSRVRLPHGETLQEVQHRVLNFFEEMMPGHTDQTVVVITHGAVGQCVLVDALQGSVQDLWLKQRMDNCQISRLEWTADTGLTLVELSDVRHLADVGSLRGWKTDPA